MSSVKGEKAMASSAKPVVPISSAKNLVPIKPERPTPSVKSEKPITATPGASGSSAGTGAGPSTTPTVQEYVVRVPKTSRKRINVMRFNATLGVDCSKWNQSHVKMERENNMRDFKGFQDDMPKFGAGSEFGREAREEARRKKYGIISKKYKPNDQPWLMRLGGKNGKRFKGTREGGVTENASYYVFTQATDGAFEAYPVAEWYNFQPIQRFKALSAEEAEEEFGRRNKILNYFSVMVRKRLKAEDGEDEEEGEGANKGKGKKKKGGDGDNADEEEKAASGSSDDDGEDADEEGGGKGKGKKKTTKKKAKKKKDSDDEANEDSDDGDEEGREVDYMSSSESDDGILDDTKLGLKGVAEEDALRKLLNSDEESEEEEKKENEDEEQEEDPDAAANKAEKEQDKVDGKKKNKKDKAPRKNDYGSSDSNMDSSESEDEKVVKGKASKGGAETSVVKTESPGKSTEGQAEKRKAEPLTATQSAIQASKKVRLDGPSPSSLSPLPAGATEGVTEESVRRYLARKPMTTTELLHKFKSKKTGLSSEQMVHHVAQILKRINPTRQTIKGKMYLSLKS